ncbi:protein-export chaperone SecB [Formicincola oecophyllae]|nr:protein-export chaperone SecB [Formicincola oecophyllae]
MPLPPVMPLAVNLQYLKDLSFEVPQGAATFARMTTPPNVGVNIDVQANRLEKDRPVFEVCLIIRVTANESTEQTMGQAPDPNAAPVFIAELNYAAVVTLEGAPQQAIEPILLVEVPRLLFPFARAIISDVTREGSFPPITLQPIDFVAMWQARQAQNQNFPDTKGEA